MRLTCLINHYDYGDFVGEALASVFAQSRVPDEIIVVDDGSHEPHLERLRAAARLYPDVRLVEKQNGGQLSCFQVGLEVATGDVILFLDADDRWRPSYVATVFELLERRPDIDFVATNRYEFFTDGTSRTEALRSRDLGYSTALCLARGGVWNGAPTSCLAIRRGVLDQIFPMPNPRAWRVCADEALVYGASMVGARKYFIGEPLVEYRVHGSNLFFGKKLSPEQAYWRRLEGRRLTEFLRRKQSLPLSLADLAHTEFRTIEAPTREEYRRYQSTIVDAMLPVRRRLRLLFALFRDYYFGQKR